MEEEPYRREDQKGEGAECRAWVGPPSPVTGGRDGEEGKKVVDGLRFRVGDEGEGDVDLASSLVQSHPLLHK